VKVLVTGGAGYIGSTIVLALLDAGDEPVVLDDLSRGTRFAMSLAPSYTGDVADRELLRRIFDEHPDIEATVHCAARTLVDESLSDPVGYYRTNVGKTVDLVAELLRAGCSKLVFSSSAAVYGRASDTVLTERTPLAPASPYARTKALVEQLLADTCAATSLSAVSLRYFNPIGCDPAQRCGPPAARAADVMGALLDASAAGAPFVIHGRDWPTSDGTPIRDFVHVWDVARAHVAALHSWPRSEGHLALNIGSGVGTTVLQLAEQFNAVVDRPVEIRFGPRRAGDVAGGYPAIERSSQLLGWRPSLSVADGVRDACARAGRLARR
jgi:UDP-glucose 4-epimerase